MLEPKLLPDPKYHHGLPFLPKGRQADLEFRHLCPPPAPPAMMDATTMHDDDEKRQLAQAPLAGSPSEPRARTSFR